MVPRRASRGRPEPNPGRVLRHPTTTGVVRHSGDDGRVGILPDDWSLARWFPVLPPPVDGGRRTRDVRSRCGNPTIARWESTNDNRSPLQFLAGDPLGPDVRFSPNGTPERHEKGHAFVTSMGKRSVPPWGLLVPKCLVSLSRTHQSTGGRSYLLLLDVRYWSRLPRPYLNMGGGGSVMGEGEARPPQEP